MTAKPAAPTRSMRQLKALLGVDRAVLYTVLWRSWMALAAPINLLLVTRFLSPVAQGFFYTFGSILALQILFELGLSQLILQFTSHERSHLDWTANRTLEGGGSAKSRLASLLRSSAAWYSTSAVLVVVLVLPVGMWLFGSSSHAGEAVNWQLPWVLFVVLSAMVFALLPVMAVLEGCGLVAEIALMRLGQIISSCLLMWVVLWRGGGLFALVAVKAVEVVWILGWLLLRHRAVLRDLLFTTPLTAVMDWRKEVWPVQWRTAVTWTSSLLITPLFNPLLFAFDGPEAAGRMGLSISMIATINTVGLAWISTKAPRFGGLIARRRFQELDGIFFPALVRSTAVVVTASLVVIAGTLYLNAIGHPWSQRILSPLPMTLLATTAVVLHLIYSEAVYLRAHKAEPFVAVAVAVSVATGVASVLLGSSFGATGICAGYLACMVAYLAFGTVIFQQKRRQWHAPGAHELRAIPEVSRRIQ